MFKPLLFVLIYNFRGALSATMRGPYLSPRGALPFVCPGGKFFTSHERTRFSFSVPVCVSSCSSCKRRCEALLGFFWFWKGPWFLKERTRPHGFVHVVAAKTTGGTAAEPARVLGCWLSLLLLHLLNPLKLLLLLELHLWKGARILQYFSLDLFGFWLWFWKGPQILRQA